MVRRLRFGTPPSPRTAPPRPQAQRRRRRRNQRRAAAAAAPAAGGGLHTPRSISACADGGLAELGMCGQHGGVWRAGRRGCGRGGRGGASPGSGLHRCGAALFLLHRREGSVGGGSLAWWNACPSVIPYLTTAPRTHLAPQTRSSARAPPLRARSRFLTSTPAGARCACWEMSERGWPPSFWARISFAPTPLLLRLVSLDHS
jgi:hypothetical protein